MKLVPHRLALRLVKRMISLMVLPAIGLLCLGIIISQPSCAHRPPTQQSVSSDRLREHVHKLAQEYVPRNYMKMWNINATASYIETEFTRSGARVTRQEFVVENRTYHNVIARFGPEKGERIVVGAHYDSCGTTPGADDNASGIAGLIELAHLLGKTELQKSVELVAYTLEEPPFFATDDMGSARHAQAMVDEGIDVKVMICLEMIGYFSDEKDSQRFPSFLLKLLYPNEGNYIAVIGGYSDRQLVRSVKASMRGATELPVYATCAARSFTEMGMSDHRNYWSRGFNAVMITDTSYYRNPNYHQDTDTPNTLDYARMSQVVLGVYEAVAYLANHDD